MKFAFVSGNRVSRYVSMNKLAKALAIFYPKGDFCQFDVVCSNDQLISDADYENLRKLHSDACHSLDSAYDN